MKKILKINTSSGLEPSTSRGLCDYLAEKLSLSTGATVTTRDLGKNPIDHLDSNTIESFYLPERAQSDVSKLAGQRSASLIDEFKEHDVIVFGVPMYNYSVPSTLKAYFDHIARPGYTFKFTSSGALGLLQGKKVFAVITRSGVLSGSSDNHQETYMKTFFSFLGIEDVTFIIAEGLFNADDKSSIIDSAQSEIDELIISSQLCA